MRINNGFYWRGRMKTKNLKIMVLLLWVVFLGLFVEAFYYFHSDISLFKSLFETMLLLILFAALPIFFVLFLKDCLDYFRYSQKNQKNYEHMQYQIKTYKSLEDAKYELEKNSHRLMRIISLMETKDVSDPLIVEELAKLKIVLKEEGYFIHTGNVIFDYLITYQIKQNFHLDHFKSIITISQNEKYDQEAFISIIVDLIELYQHCDDVEMRMTEKTSWVLIDISCLKHQAPDYKKWLTLYPHILYEVQDDEVGREHFKIMIEEAVTK